MKFQLHIIFAIVCLVPLPLLGQGVTVTATLTDGQGIVQKTSYLHWQLWNCGNNVPQIVGQPYAVVAQQFDMRANPSTGVINGAVYGKDQILCGNVASTQWIVTQFKASGQPGGQPQYYCLTSGQTFNPATTQPCQIVPPPPGFELVIANPIQNQTLDQPAGTVMNFEGTMNFCSATLLCAGNGSGGGAANESVSFTSATSASLTTSFATADLTYQCWDGASPANAIYPANVTLNSSTYVVTFTFAVPQTGFCAVNGSGGGAGPSVPAGADTWVQYNHGGAALGANAGFTFNPSTGLLEISNAGSFANTQMNEYAASYIGGVSPTLYRDIGYGQYVTEAISGNVLVPSGAAIGQANGISGEVESNCNSVGATTCDAVGVFGLAVANANGAAAWGANFVVLDTPGLTGEGFVAIENDIGVAGTPNRVHGVDITLSPGNGTAGTMPATADNGVALGIYSSLIPTLQWPTGIYIATGSVSHNAIWIDRGCLTGSCSSPPIVQTGFDGTNSHVTSTTADSAGDIVLTPTTGESLVINGKINQFAAGQFAGSCAMASNTGCTFTLAHAYTAPICIATVQSSTVIAGSCFVSGTTVTIQAASSNSLTWGAMVIGNPN